MRKLKNSELNRKSIAEFKQSKKTPFIVVLDNVRSLNNIGSIFRTSDALLIEAIYLCGFTATPPHKDIHKTALGATESVNWKYFETTADAISELKKNNIFVASIEQAEESVSIIDFKIEEHKKYAFVFGHEVKGVSQQIVDISDCCIEIPQFGTKHSFNISVSAGIVLWDLFKKYKTDILHKP
ncbi:MAG: RNA methyltransferase [Bacteroidota bacterium]|nr:RNA methyltransferase [Bacteroidota bacterium]